VPPPPRPDVVDRLRGAGCVFAEEEAALLADEAATDTDLEVLLARRVAGEPLEQVLGWAAFCGLRITVEPHVFVPRRRTELMVREALASVAATPAPVVVDLCCGSGAVGAALAAALPDIELYAADIDPAAVRCARRNVAPADHVVQGDLFEPLPQWLRGRVDVLTANTPYVPTEAIASLPPEARDHEPTLALDGGSDGLEVARRVAGKASSWLTPGGSLLIETSERQVQSLMQTFTDRGLTPRVATCEDLGATVVIGRRA
jgi:release factor glutamine methyltransferase